MTMVNVYSVAVVSVIDFPLDKHYWPYNTFFFYKQNLKAIHLTFKI